MYLCNEQKNGSFTFFTYDWIDDSCDGSGESVLNHIFGKGGGGLILINVQYDSNNDFMLFKRIKTVEL